MNNSCYNCGSKLEENSMFCPKCGQKKEALIQPIHKLLSFLVSGIFNLDSKVPKTFLHLFIPGKLTKVFFKGKRKSYSHPLKMYLFISFILFWVIGYQSNQSFEQSKFFEKLDAKKTLEKKKQLFILDSISNEIAQASNNHEYSAGAKSIVYLYQGHKWKSELADTFTTVVSSLTYAPDTNKISINEINDSILLTYEGKASDFHRIDSLYRLKVENTLEPDSIDLGFLLNRSRKESHSKNIALNDLANLTNTIIYEKYDIEGFWNRRLLGQAIKIIKAPANAMYYVLSGFSWVALLFIPLIAIWLKLIYLRQKKYYIEHLVFSVHLTTFTFLIILIYLLVNSFNNNQLSLLLLGAIPIYIYFAFKQYFQQSNFKTWIKGTTTFLVSCLMVFTLFLISIMIRMVLF